jgi:hypothetical protein
MVPFYVNILYLSPVQSKKRELSFSSFLLLGLLGFSEATQNCCLHLIIGFCNGQQVHHPIPVTPFCCLFSNFYSYGGGLPAHRTTLTWKPVAFTTLVKPCLPTHKTAHLIWSMGAIVHLIILVIPPLPHLKYHSCCWVTPF